MTLILLVAAVAVVAVAALSSSSTTLGIPVRHAAGNVLFTYEGTTWVLLRVHGPTYGRLPAKDKLMWHSRLSAALMSLPADSMLLGVSRPLNPQAVVSAMIEGVDVERCPRWAQVALDTLDSLEEAGITDRVHYLAFALPAGKRAANILDSFSAAAASVSQRFGLPPVPVSAKVVRAARAQAADLTKPLLGFLGADRVTPATVAEVEWLMARNALRGMSHTEKRGDRQVVVNDEPSLEEFQSVGAPTVLSAPRLAALGEAVVFEGGDDADVGRPKHRRYIRVDTERGRTYQTFAVFSHMPAAFSFPGGRGEVLAQLDHFDVPLDWCVRVTPTTNAAAQLAITGQIRQLAGQFEEYQGDLAGAPDTLNHAIEEMRAEVAQLAASPSVPELRATFILAIGAPTLPELEERVERVRALMGANDYKMPRPTGSQRVCWAAFMPGSPSPTVAKDYSQFLLPRDLAGCAPFAGSDLGDDRGDLLALNVDTGGKPVLFWAGTGPNLAPPEGPKSGSIGVFGRLGGGKSYLIKRIIAATVAMGGRVVVPDRTPMGEYVRLIEPLRSAGHSAQVIQLGENADVCLDPLVVFRGLEDRVRYGTGFLTLLTGTEPTSAEGSVLDKAVRRVAERGGRLREVVAELEHRARSTDTSAAFAHAAETVALKVSVFLDGSLSRLVFGDGPPVRLDADYTVFWAPSLALPSHESMKERRLMMPEQVFGMALLYLVTAVSSSVAFDERDRFSLVVTDEGYSMDTPQGQELLGRVLRDGRKHGAALLFGSHHPSDLDPRLRELLGSRFLFRMDRSAAPAGLAFMDMEATPAELDLIDEARRAVGECLYRDLHGRLGLVHILPPRTPELRAAFDTGLTHAHDEASGTRRTRRPRVGAQ